MSAPSTAHPHKTEAMQRRLAQLSQAMGHGSEPEAARPAEHRAPQPPAAPHPPTEPPSPTVPARPRAGPWLWGALGLMTLSGAWLLFQDAGATASERPVAPAAQMAPEPTPTTALAPFSDDAVVRHMVEQWRLDWSRRDVQAYLGHYSARFEAAGGQTRAQWEAQRRKNLLNRTAIRVEVNDLRLDRQDASHVRVHFLQTYLSGAYQEAAQPKTLSLVLEDGRWRIDREWQGQGPAKSGPAS